jgi:hypothetical protein
MAAEEWTEALDVAKDLRFLCPCDTGLGKEIYNTEYNAEISVSQMQCCGSESWASWIQIPIRIPYHQAKIVRKPLIPTVL